MALLSARLHKLDYFHGNCVMGTNIGIYSEDVGQSCSDWPCKSCMIWTGSPLTRDCSQRRGGGAFYKTFGKFVTQQNNTTKDESN